MSVEGVNITLCRVYENLPEAVEAVAFSPCGFFIALSRHHGSTQIINASSLHIYATLPNTVLHGSANAIHWVSKRPQLSSALASASTPNLAAYRLITTGLHGLIFEWDLEFLLLVRQSQSYGGAIFGSALSPDSSRLYLACDDGTLRVFSLFSHILGNLEPQLALIDTIKHPKGRILSVIAIGQASAPETQVSRDIGAGNVIFCGTSKSTIYKHCNGQSHSMKLGEPVSYAHGGHKAQALGNKRERSIQVWSLAYIYRDKCLISGDSLGVIRFWDTINCIETKVFEHHSADILCMATTIDQKTLYTAGVDMKLSILGCDLDSNSWAVTGVRYPHKGSIKCLSVDSRFGHVVTGGEDCYLCLLSGLRDLSGFSHQVTKLLPVPAANESPVDFSTGDFIAVCKYRICVDVWKISCFGGHNEAFKLASLALDKSQGDVITASVARNSSSAGTDTYVCVGNIAGIRIFNVKDDAVEKVHVSISSAYYYSVKFVSGNNLLCSTFNGDNRKCQILNYSVKNGVLNSFDLEEPVVRIAILSSSIVSLHCLSGKVLLLDWKKWLFLELSLLKYPEIFTSVCLLEPNNDILIAFTSNRTFYIYTLNLESGLLEFKHPVHKVPLNICSEGDALIHSSQCIGNSIILQTQTSLISISLAHYLNAAENEVSGTLIESKTEDAIAKSKKLRLGPPLLDEPKFKVLLPPLRASGDFDNMSLRRNIGSNLEVDIGTGGMMAGHGNIELEPTSDDGFKVVNGLKYLIHLVQKDGHLLAFQIPSLDIDLQERNSRYAAS